MTADDRLARAIRELPYGVEHDPRAMKTLDDLVHSARLQLDLIEEGQESADDIDPRPIRRWLQKFATA